MPGGGQISGGDAHQTVGPSEPPLQDMPTSGVDMFHAVYSFLPYQLRPRELLSTGKIRRGISCRQRGGDEQTNGNEWVSAGRQCRG